MEVSEHQDIACTKIAHMNLKHPMWACIRSHRMKISKVSDYASSKIKHPRADATHDRRQV